MILCPEEFNTYPERKLKLSLMILFALTCLFPSIIYIMLPTTLVSCASKMQLCGSHPMSTLTMGYSV